MFDDKYYSLEEIMREKYGHKYIWTFMSLCCRLWCPQNRERAIIRMWKDGFSWEDHKSKKELQ